MEKNEKTTTDLEEALVKYMSNGYYSMAMDCIELLYKEDKKYAKYIPPFRKVLKEMIARNINVNENYDILHNSYLLTVNESFDDFMIALEWYRPNEEKFWLVRREQLLPVCQALEGLYNDEYDELFLSMPPRVGKTTIVMFFVLWFMCKNPQQSNLYASFTEKVVKSFYNGIMEIVNDPITYDLKSCFPKFKLASTDAKDLLIDFGRKKRYPSLTARSVDGSLNGSCDCSGILIADDLHSGIDEARNKDLLVKKWETVRANLLSRAKGTCKILWIGTHWSLIDCISNRINMLESDKECAHIRKKVFNLPALDDFGNSNFDYMFHKGFSTEDYHVIRASYEQKDDIALWLAPYMGTPIEREGSVFSPDDMRYYNGDLPLEDPDRIFMVVDPAWGGGDYVSAPLCYQYGDEIFIADVVYNNADKSVTEPLIVEMAFKHNASAIYIEATRTTSSYSDDVDKRLREKGRRINIVSTTKHWSGQEGKQQRIFDKAPEIRERMVFLASGYRSKEYEQFMQNVFSFTIEGKNKHDDAPDSLAMVICNAFSYAKPIQIMRRVF